MRRQEAADQPADNSSGRAQTAAQVLEDHNVSFMILPYCCGAERSVQRALILEGIPNAEGAPMPSRQEDPTRRPQPFVRHQPRQRVLPNCAATCA